MKDENFAKIQNSYEGGDDMFDPGAGDAFVPVSDQYENEKKEMTF
jgi:hypothetical protein